MAGEFATRDDTESFLSVYHDGGDAIVIDDLAIDDLGPAPAVAAETAESAAESVWIDDKLPNRAVLLEDSFAKPLSADWTVIASKRPGTKVAVADGVLRIEAAANVSALAERKLPAGTTAVECRLVDDGDAGQTWGAGLCVFWPGGQKLRINLRTPDGRFGIDSTAAAQTTAGSLAGADSIAMRIRVEADKVVAEARNDAANWQPLASFPRDKFPGAARQGPTGQDAWRRGDGRFRRSRPGRRREHPSSPHLR